jgi:hypothetical protein
MSNTNKTESTTSTNTPEALPAASKTTTIKRARSTKKSSAPATTSKPYIIKLQDENKKLRQFVGDFIVSAIIEDNWTL